METSIRQLLANGKYRTAMERAKDFHKDHPGSLSEGLLLDAYAARIGSLFDQKLETEAKSLLALVRDRFPAAKERLDRVMAEIGARGGDLAGLLQPLNDPALDGDRRAAIDKVLQTGVTDLAALAGCAALPPEHPLRKAAGALHQAFDAVTIGPVTDERIALPEVSYRSPLAPWKPLIQAIASLYRGEERACREYLAAIKPESVPSRLTPVIREMLGEKTGKQLTAAELTLCSRTSANLGPLRNTLAEVDDAFAGAPNENRLFKAIRAAVRECQRSAPDRIQELRHRIAVRCGRIGEDNDRLAAALEGPLRPNAEFFRMYARAMENTPDPEDLETACEMWDGFLLAAVREGWFPEKGIEAAVVYLHIAELLESLPRDLVRKFQQYGGPPGRSQAQEERYFVEPGKLYERACAADPHPDNFSRWLRWARERSVSRTEDVAKQWHRVLPGDIEPLLYLMSRAEMRKSFPKALGFLDKAERIDPVNAAVRAARFRLLAEGALRHVQQWKPHLADGKLKLLTALPQAQQGDRPAFLAALRHVIRVASGDAAGAAEAHADAERELGGILGAGLLIFGVANAAKQREAGLLPPVKSLSKEERSAIPKLMARLLILARELNVMQFNIPVPYIEETVAQFPRVCKALDAEELRALGEMGIASEYAKLAWAAAGEGLSRGGPTEAYFLLLRARAIPPFDTRGIRHMALVAAAGALSRLHRDMDTVDQSVELLRSPFGGDTFSLTVEQSREVVRRELASPAFPSSSRVGPNYADLFPDSPCDCPDCRRAREESLDPSDDEDEDGDDDLDPILPIDEEEMKRSFFAGAPKGIPPELLNVMFEVAKEGFLAGDSIDDIMARIMGPAAGKPKKGRRKK